MTNRRTSSAASAFFLVLVTTMAAASPAYSHNITAILAEDPRFATFNHHLTATGLADLINSLAEVTVCAMDNSAMSELLSLNPTPTSLRRVLLFHLFSHYFDTEHLNSSFARTLFPRPSGVDNETVSLTEINGTVFFTYPYTSECSELLGYVKQVPPHLSVLHVSNVLPSPEAWSLQSPIETLKIISEVGCKAFAGAVAESPVAERWLRENAYVGMTVLCPLDSAWESFEPRFRAMTEEEKVYLLLFHAMPMVHYRCEFSWTLHGWMPLTLASFYREKPGFAGSVKMEAVKKLMVGVGLYDEVPLVVYPIRGVLLPDDPVGVVEYFDPNTSQFEETINQDCVELVGDFGMAEVDKSWELNTS